MATHFNDWLTTEREKEIRAWSRDLGLFNIEVDMLLDRVRTRLITLKQCHITEAQMLARIQKLADIKEREGYTSMEMLNDETKEKIRAEVESTEPAQPAPAAYELTDPEPVFGIGVEIVYTGSPLRVPSLVGGFLVVPGTGGTIRDDSASGWMVQFHGFESEVSVPESDLRRADAPAPIHQELNIDDLVRVSMRGEGFVKAFRAGGHVLVKYATNETWEPRALVHLLKTRQQLVQEQLETLENKIKALELEKAAEVDRARMYQQRAENAEQKANHAPLPSIGEVDALRQQNDTLGREVTLLRAQLAGVSLVAPDEQNPGIQTRTIIQDMQTPERQAAAEREYNALRRAGWDVVHIQFSADLKSRAVMLELDTTPASPFDDAINEALSRLEEDEQEAPAGNPAPAIEGVIIGLDDDDEEETSFTFKLEDVRDSSQLFQLYRSGAIDAADYKEHANRIVYEKGKAAFEASQAARKPYVNPFRIKVAPVLAEVQS